MFVPFPKHGYSFFRISKIIAFYFLYFSLYRETNPENKKNKAILSNRLGV